METRKVDDHTLEVTRTVPQTATYELGALKRQRAAIQASRDAELAEVDALIAEAEKLGLKESPSADVLSAIAEDR